MSQEAGILFLSLLALLCQLFVISVLVAVGLARAGRTALLDSMRVSFGPNALLLAATIAIVATVGSLWLSESVGFIPCRLCWYQRMMMYPLGLVLIAAILSREQLGRLYAILLASFGAAISTYHILIERFPSLEGSTCDPKIPCTLIWTQRFGYMTIPVMALSGFLAILALLWIDKTSNKEQGLATK